MHRAPKISMYLRAISTLAMTVSLAVVGCTSSSKDIEGGIPAKATPINSTRSATEQHHIDAEPTPHSELKMRWRDAKDLSRAIVDSSTGLVVDVENATPKRSAVDSSSSRQGWMVGASNVRFRISSCRPKVASRSSFRRRSSRFKARIRCRTFGFTPKFSAPTAKGFRPSRRRSSISFSKAIRKRNFSMNKISETWIRRTWISHEAASSPTTISTLFSIYKRACGNALANCTTSDTVHWNDLRAAALTHYVSALNPLFVRFDSTGDATGVNH